MRLEKSLPDIIILLTGFVTMAYEVAGARVLGPYFGSSVFVWTSLIGIIMGSLSLGYWLGGKLSVLQNRFRILAWMLVVAAIFILITAIADIYILDRIVKYIPGVRLGTVVSVAMLFGPSSVCFGMILPYAVRIRVKDVASSGGTIGNLYALSTVGSIAGTFAAGFLLIPATGYTNVLFTLSALLLVLSLPVFLVDRHRLTFFLACSVLAVLGMLWYGEHSKAYDYIDVDTQYNRVLIYETTDPATGRPIRMLRVNDENSSAMFLDSDDDLVFEVLKYYRLMEHFVPGFESALMVGGSGYAFPKDYLQRYPGCSLDVVEIDAGLTALARQYFGLEENPLLNIYHEDGRTFLNRNTKQYDAVLMDAYKSMITIPYQLTTLEAVQHIYDALGPQGGVFANVISSLDPENNQFLMAELATYKAVFPQVYLFAVQYPNPTEEQKKFFQNFILVGLKSSRPLPLHAADSLLNAYLSHHYAIDVPEGTSLLTDEYAPVEFMASQALK